MNIYYISGEDPKCPIKIMFLYPRALQVNMYIYSTLDIFILVLGT